MFAQTSSTEKRPRGMEGRTLYDGRQTSRHEVKRRAPFNVLDIDIGSILYTETLVSGNASFVG